VPGVICCVPSSGGVSLVDVLEQVGYDTLRLAWPLVGDLPEQLPWERYDKRLMDFSVFAFMRVDGVYFNYSSNERGDWLTLESSLPKLLWENNAQAVAGNDLTESMVALQQVVWRYFVEAPPVWEMLMRRADAVCDYHLANEQEVGAVVHRLAEAPLRGKYPIRYSPTSLRWPQKSTVRRVYGKLAEMRASGAAAEDDPFAPEGQLRFECQVNGQKAMKDALAFSLASGDLSSDALKSMQLAGSVGGQLTPRALLEVPDAARRLLGSFKGVVDAQVQREASGEDMDAYEVFKRFRGRGLRVDRASALIGYALVVQRSGWAALNLAPSQQWQLKQEYERIGTEIGSVQFCQKEKAA